MWEVIDVGRNYAWLPHLTNEIVSGARKTKLCAYSVALEGWRRGLELKWYTADSKMFNDMIIFGVNPPGRLFSLSSQERTHYFFRTRGDKVSNEAVQIGSDKDETKFWLAKAGVPVPEGKMFGEEIQDESIISYAVSIGFPVVLKPTNGSLGKGVITNIKNGDELRKALFYVRKELGYTEVIVERYVPGDEYRVYVVEDQVIGAYNRLPANIIGDGIHSIKELIELKNQERKKNPRLHSCLIEIDQEILDFIQWEGYSLDSVPEKGKRIFLREKSNVSAGGDPIDVTDQLPIKIKDMAVNAIKAIPGLHHGGVDIIVGNNSEDKEVSAVVIELNPTAQIGGILFPIKGQARDIPSAIIDYYFPETKGLNSQHSNIYFDLNTVLDPLQSRSALEVQVAPAPLGRLYAKKYIVSGKVQRVSYQQWLRQQAFDLNLSGFINNVYDGTIEVVVAGTNKADVNNFKNILFQAPAKGTVKKVVEETWDEPVKVGFEISEELNGSSTNLRSVETKLKKIKREMNRLEKEHRRMVRRVVLIEQSRSWKYTRPLREIGKWLKNLLKSFKPKGN